MTTISIKPKLLDTFCKAGGCTKGYQMAGFEVVGIDIEPQPRYIGDDFVQMDALEALRILIAGGYIVGKSGRRWYLSDFLAIHASPPCQIHCEMTKGRWKDHLKNHVNLIPEVRYLLIASGKPYVIENVEGARKELINPLLLCGTMFGLQARNDAQLWRHRLFECSPAIWFPPASCYHKKQPAIGVYGGGQHPLRKNRRRKNAVIGVYGSTDPQSSRDGKSFYGIDDRKIAMGIDWMTGKELNQAIPPKFTEYIGQRLMEVLLA